MTNQADQTITRSVECGLEPARVFAVLADAELVVKWAPLFADAMKHLAGSRYTATKGDATFGVEVLVSEASGTVDYVRDMGDGKRGGAYVRVTPRPMGGSTLVMTVPLGPSANADQVGGVVMEELRAVVELARQLPERSKLSAQAKIMRN